MEKKDFRAICVALGAVMAQLQKIEPEKLEAQSAKGAELIEAICRKIVPNTFRSGFSRDEPNADTDYRLDCYLEELRSHGSANLDFDRDTLLLMFELLYLYELRDGQKQFYETATDAQIATRIAQKADECLLRRGR